MQFRAQLMQQKREELMILKEENPEFSFTRSMQLKDDLEINNPHPNPNPRVLNLLRNERQDTSTCMLVINQYLSRHEEGIHQGKNAVFFFSGKQ